MPETWVTYIYMVTDALFKSSSAELTHGIQVANLMAIGGWYWERPPFGSHENMKLNGR